MGHRKKEYALPLKYPIDTRQAYELMLDIEVGRLAIVPDVRYEIYSFKFVNGKIVMDSTIAKIKAVCTSTEIVFTSKLHGWATFIPNILYFCSILTLPVTIGALSTITSGMNIMFILGICFLLFGLWLFSKASGADKMHQAIAKRLVELVYDNM